MTSPWEEGTVYLLASVESVRIMVDLASLGLLLGQLLCRFLLSEEFEAAAPLLGDGTQQAGPQLQGQ